MPVTFAILRFNFSVGVCVRLRLRRGRGGGGKSPGAGGFLAGITDISFQRSAFRLSSIANHAAGQRHPHVSGQGHALEYRVVRFGMQLVGIDRPFAVQIGEKQISRFPRRITARTETRSEASPSGG